MLFAVLLALQLSLAPPVLSPDQMVLEHRVDRLSDAQLLKSQPRLLVSERRQRAATTYEEVREAFVVVTAAGPLFVLFWLWRSGRAAALREWLRRGLRRSPFKGRWAFSSSLVAIAW